MSLEQVQELNYNDYLLYRRDAFIYAKESTKEGKKYLENAWTLTQTKPDRGKLRERFGGE